MNLAGITFPARSIGAVTFAVLIVGGGAGTALGDPALHARNYFAQVAVGTRPDDRAGIRGPNAPAFTTATSTPVRPDDRAAVRGIGTTAVASTGAAATAVRPDDRAAVRGIGTTAVASAAPALTADAAGSGFDWVDAGIGAASTLALILIGGGVFLIGTRRHGDARGKPTAPALHG
jgi:hypothetical protein